MDLFTLPHPASPCFPPPPPVWADYVANTWLAPRPLHAYVGFGHERLPETWSYGTAAEVASDFTWGMRTYVWRNI